MRYILGDGFSGLIAGFYLDVPVIGKENHRVPRGPFYIWDTPETMELVKDLGLEVGKRTVRIGYNKDEGFVPFSPEIFEIYTRKVGPMGSMTNKKSSIDILEVDTELLYSELRKKNTVINDEIVRIDQALRGDKSDYGFDEIISTIPLPELLKLLKLESNLKYLPIHFVKAESTENFIWENEFDYIYLLDEYPEFYRVTKKKYPVCVFESTAPVLGFGKWTVTVISFHIMKYGKILSGSPPELENIKLLGRFSEWNPSIRIHDVVGKVKSWT